MLIDANLLLYAVDHEAPQHEVARTWLAERLAGPGRVGLPWQSLGGMLRISTDHRVYARPLTREQAWGVIERWLAAPAAWVPAPGRGFAQILGELIIRHRVSGALVPDAMLAALALEHGVALASTDTDFARFTELRWVNPLT